jgi:hypothetical protein
LCDSLSAKPELLNCKDFANDLPMLQYIWMHWVHFCIFLLYVVTLTSRHQSIASSRNAPLEAWQHDSGGHYSSSSATPGWIWTAKRTQLL